MKISCDCHLYRTTDADNNTSYLYKNSDWYRLSDLYRYDTFRSFGKVKMKSREIGRAVNTSAFQNEAPSQYRKQMPTNAFGNISSNGNTHAASQGNANNIKPNRKFKQGKIDIDMEQSCLVVNFEVEMVRINHPADLMCEPLLRGYLMYAIPILSYIFICSRWKTVELLNPSLNKGKSKSKH